MLYSQLMLDIIDVIPVEKDDFGSILVSVWMSSTSDMNRSVEGVICTIPDFVRC